MAVVLVREVKCDVCESPDAETVFFQLADGSKYDIDLCADHRQPIKEMVKYARPGRPRRQKTRDQIVVQQPKKRAAAKKA